MRGNSDKFHTMSNAFKIRLEVVGGASMTDRRTEFWSNFSKNEKTVEEDGIKVFEKIVENELGIKLKEIYLNELTRRLQEYKESLIMSTIWLRDRPFRDKYELSVDDLHVKGMSEAIMNINSLYFSFRISKYDSLGLDGFVGSMENLEKVFKSVDGFEVFLSAYVPRAFYELFEIDDDSRIICSVDFPLPFRNGFVAVSGPTRPNTNLNESFEDRKTKIRRADLIWLIANGSLVLPVALLIFIQYQGHKMTVESSESNRKMLETMNAHQKALLDEDRKRLMLQDDYKLQQKHSDTARQDEVRIR